MHRDTIVAMVNGVISMAGKDGFHEETFTDAKLIAGVKEYRCNRI